MWHPQIFMMKNTKFRIYFIWIEFKKHWISPVRQNKTKAKQVSQNCVYKFINVSSANKPATVRRNNSRKYMQRGEWVNWYVRTFIPWHLGFAKLLFVYRGLGAGSCVSFFHKSTLLPPRRCRTGRWMTHERRGFNMENCFSRISTHTRHDWFYGI